MATGLTTIIFPVTDLEKATPVYSALLGARPTTDEVYYVGFSVGDQEIGLDPHGHAHGMNGPVAYREVDDVATALTTLIDAGAVEQQATRDVGGGKLIATVTDNDGNVIGLIQSP